MGRPGAAGLSAPRPARWTRVYLGLYLGYLVLGGTLRWGLWPGWPAGWIHVDHIWFVDAARHILDGSWRIYQFRSSPDIAPPAGLAYSYSPLPALLMAPFVALAEALRATPLAAGVGGTDPLAYRLIIIPLLLADVLAMDQFRRLVHAWRPQVDETALFLGILPTLLVTGFLEVSAHRDHQEGLVLLLLLLTLRYTPTQPALGGALAGLTLAAKHTAVLELLPLAAVLLTAVGRNVPEGQSGIRNQGSGLLSTLASRYASLVWGGAAAAVFGAFLLLPFLANRDELIYALLTQEQRRVILGQGLPAWIDLGLGAALGKGGAAYALWHDRLLRYSNLGLGLGAGALVAGVLWWNGRRSHPLGLRDSRLLALVALGGLLQVVLAKWVSGHYYQVPLALTLLWDIVRRAPRWPAVGLGGTLGFRAITVAVVLPDLPWIKDGLLFTLFTALAGAALGAALGPEPAPPLTAAPGAQAPLPAPAAAGPGPAPRTGHRPDPAPPTRGP